MTEENKDKTFPKMTPNFTSFTVDFGQQNGSRVPKRFQNQQCKPKITTMEDIEKKQRQAEARRKNHEEMKAETARVVREECAKINDKAMKLFEQDAKRQGLPGTEHIRPMTRKQASLAIREMSHDMNKLASGMNSNISLPST
ncbi:hypothetical protein CHS0354_014547 [Potamilus streckersoni]|uniref:Uncharacterized protein n=1 Tax=Potamilus streckersoni TaxID=2493646 RepID=A0AAE0VSY7_9BIVA|nr:hypothetical protein CHS0354_014547 [Potamilus streckersoni]